MNRNRTKTRKTTKRAFENFTTGTAIPRKLSLLEEPTRKMKKIRQKTK